MAKQNPAFDPSLLLRIADAVPALVALYNIRTGRYIYVNRAAQKLLGYRPEQFIEGGMEFAASLVHEEDLTRIMAENQRALEAAGTRPKGDDDPIVNFEYRMKHRDGGWRWLHTDGTVFGRDQDGQVELVLNVSLDITERKKAELQLRRTMQALESAMSVQ